MGKKSKKAKRRFGRVPFGVRAAAAGVLALIWSGAFAWVHATLKAESAASRTESTATLDGLADVAHRLYLAETDRLASGLNTTRQRLRKAGVWTQVGQRADDLGQSDSDPELRRLELSLRTVLADWPDLAELELVVAGSQGLSMVGFEQTDDRPRKIERDAKARLGSAKAYWYSDPVRRAVSRGGDEFVEGTVEISERTGTAQQSFVMGLHEPGEVVQGVLIASLNVSTLAQSLESVGLPGLQVRIVNAEGVQLSGDPQSPEQASRTAALTARVLSQSEGYSVFEADEALVLGRPLVTRDGRLAHMWALLEIKSPDTAWAALARGPWPIVLVAYGLVSVLAIGLLRKPSLAKADSAAEATDSEDASVEAVDSAVADTPATTSASVSEDAALPESPAPERDEETPEPQAIEAAAEAESAEPADAAIPRLSGAPATERIELRTWLGDVRGCLEREAAVRGLALDFRCMRALPSEVETDPRRVGGLILAMGREALDATPSDRVCLEVHEAGDEDLLFVLDAGAQGFSAVPVWKEEAASLGARFEGAGKGRLELVLSDVCI